MSENYWNALETGAQSLRKIIDELWKIWRWFGIGVLGLRAYDATDSTQALIFGIGVTAIGVAALASWIFGGIVPGVTKKGRTSGMIIGVALGFGIFVISIYLAVQLWTMVAILALPVFPSQ
ncbi:hypothetical protein [Paracoccus onubensis]|uniref:Uncharacterized protein n=1 Tax=Paracoccus onubensis TaxID=1675788 RepID=A0A418SVP6_9RHOB|nr:hypothetical protein [Paracoccus onubensis]RJE85033.1 hypothetical protein D3P04_12135 [Paracoccus onubensis]